MAAFNKFDQYVKDHIDGVHKFKAADDLLKVYLSNAVPSQTLDLIKTDLAEIIAENGYTAGGDDIQNDTSKSGATSSLTAVDVTVTASAGTIGPFQFIVAYNDTPITPLDPLISWWDRGSALTLQDGESHTTDFGATVLGYT